MCLSLHKYVGVDLKGTSVAKRSEDEHRIKQNERQRAWRAKNAEKAKAYRARYSAANKDEILERQRLTYRKKHGTKGRKEYKLSASCFQRARRVARERGWEFDLTREFLDSIAPTHCPVLGLKLEVSTGKGGADNSYSIDRVDSSKGYTKDNVVIISWRANRIKSDSTPEELRKLADFFTVVF